MRIEQGDFKVKLLDPGHVGLLHHTSELPYCLIGKERESANLKNIVADLFLDRVASEEQVETEPQHPGPRLWRLSVA